MWVGEKLGKAWSVLRGSADKATTWVWERTKPARLMLRSLRWIQWVFLVTAIAAGWFGYHLQGKAFPLSAPSPFAQISATVYTRVNPSRVLLKTWIAPNASQQDVLDITVRGPQGKPDPWLLVVTCPHRVAARVKMQLVGAGMAAPQSAYVLASVHDRSHEVLPLGCVSGPPSQHGRARPVVVTGQDINLSLPVLEQIPLGQSSVASTPLYVMRRPTPGQAYKPNLLVKQNLPIKELMMAFQAPGSTCSDPGGATPSPRPSATAANTLDKNNGDSTPSPSPSGGASAGTTDNACYTPSAADGIVTKYNIPTSVATSETLENVSLSGDRIDSMFPPGQITSNYQIIWQGAFGLSPDLSATSLRNDENANRDGFFAGLCYGLAAGLFVPFLQGLSDAHEKLRKDHGSAPGGAGQTSGD